MGHHCSSRKNQIGLQESWDFSFETNEEKEQLANYSNGGDVRLDLRRKRLFDNRYEDWILSDLDEAD